MTVKCTEKNQSVKNVIATMAVEDTYLSKEFVSKLIEVASGKRSSEELRQEVIRKYARKAD